MHICYIIPYRRHSLHVRYIQNCSQDHSLFATIMSLERYTKPDLGIIQVLWGIGFHNEATCTLLVEQTLDFSPNDLSLFHQIMLSLGSVAPVITVSMYHYEMGN